jgi:lysozyme
MNNLLIDMLKRHEGFRSKPYRCTAGKLTIGYGHNLEDVGVSEAEALVLLYNDIDRASQDVRSILPEFDSFSISRQNALVDMMFNLGKTRFVLFKKMIRAIKNKDWWEASRQAKDSKWHNQVGERALEIENLLIRG